MDKARIFNQQGEPIIVSAQDVLTGIVSRESEFVDPEYEFRVVFVKSSKGHGKPYFRLYMSREDYKRLSPEQKQRYQILCDMRHYQESPWHRGWEDKVSSFCDLERTFWNLDTKEGRRSDAYCMETETCIEFQHSFIALDFENRNAFYNELGLNIVWLYDLTRAGVKLNDDGLYEILEDNARGFFRIAEKPENLERWPVFFQAKDGLIYRVKRLDRKEVDSSLKSTIRLFKAEGIYTEDAFLELLQSGAESIWSDDYRRKKKGDLHTVSELWDSSYSFMIIQDAKEPDDQNAYIMVNRDKNGDIFRDYEFGCVQYKYVIWNGTNYTQKNSKDYSLSKLKENQKRWNIVFSYPYLN